MTYQEWELLVPEDHIGHILRLPHSSKWDRRGALSGQLAGLHPQAAHAEVTIELGKHVRVDEARADTVHPNAIGG